MDLKQQKFNFVKFTRVRWPSLESKDLSQPLTFAAAGKAVESLFWLGLGSELSVFPTEHARRLTTLSKPTISRLKASNEDRLKLVSPEVQWLELVELLGSGDVDHFPDRIAPEARLVPYFNSAVHLSHWMNSDVLGSSFREFIMFAKHAQWSEIIQNPVSVDVISDLLLHGRSPSRPSLESIVAGFFSTSRKMTTLNDFFSTLEQDNSVSGTKSTLIRRCGRITCWCLDFSLNDVKDRFLEAAAVAEAVLDNISTVTDERVVVNGEAFNESIKTLADRWEQHHPKFLTMTA